MAEGDDYGRFKLKQHLELDIEKLTREGLSFEIDNSAGEGILTETKSGPTWTMLDDTYPRIGRQPRTFIPDEVVEAESEDPALGSFDELGRNFKNITDDGGVKTRLVRVGNGRKPPLHATVFIEFEAWAECDDEPFYKTTPGEWYKFRFFQPNILGWLDYAVSEMEQYEVSHFLVAPKYMYGEHGLLGVVAENTTVLFKVQLMKFIEAPTTPNLLSLTPEERSKVSFDDYVKSATELKAFAKKNIRDENWGFALDKYKKASRIMESFVTLDKDLDGQRNDMLHSLYNNMAFCQLKFKEFPQVIYMCKKALELPPGTKGDAAKIYYRYALAEFEVGHYEKSMELTRMAKKIQPCSPEIVELFHKVQNQLEEDRVKQKKLYEKMGSQLSLQDKPEAKEKGQSHSVSKNPG